MKIGLVISIILNVLLSGLLIGYVLFTSNSIPLDNMIGYTKTYSVASELFAPVVTLEGTITNVDYSCFVDGKCSVEIDNTWTIFTSSGGELPTTEEPTVWGTSEGINYYDNDLIGKRVEVRAKKTGTNLLTLEGDTDYYARIIEDSVLD